MPHRVCTRLLSMACIVVLATQLTHGQGSQESRSQESGPHDQAIHSARSSSNRPNHSQWPESAVRLMESDPAEFGPRSNATHSSQLNSIVSDEGLAHSNQLTRGNHSYVGGSSSSRALGPTNEAQMDESANVLRAYSGNESDPQDQRHAESYRGQHTQQTSEAYQDADVLRAAYNRATGVVPRQSESESLMKVSRKSWLDKLNDEAEVVREQAQLAERWERRSMDSTESESLPPSLGKHASFIDRETSDAAEDPGQMVALVSKIGINLALVLAIALGAVLIARGMMKSKTTSSVGFQSEMLDVKQVLRLNGGAALHVVDGFNKRFLVAIDAAGIKSVNVLSAESDEGLTFEDAMSQAEESFPAKPDRFTPVESRPSRRDRLSSRTKVSSKEDEKIESTPEIDRQLIEMLLRGSNAAA